MGANDPSLAFTALQASDAAQYRVAVVDGERFTLSRPAEVLVAEPRPGRIVNMSVRGTAGVDGQPLIVGFVTAGGSKQVLLRAVGPALAGSKRTTLLPRKPRGW